jgi:ArsR family transcriptional regulator, arsenate/arsenite/antimonite-responsive transcriptional repressor
MELLQVLKAIGEETRIRMLNLLMQSDLCVGEIEYFLDINQSNTSRHLSTLKNASLIVYEKKAQWIYYKLNKKVLAEYPFLKELLADEAVKLELCIKDTERLKQYKDSGMNCSDLKTCLMNECEE